ncbi:MAG: hypothetical protein JXA52_01090 [Planctomycetes bacterium]|nr:hypothetical protein [Planctomycetota bacterium]
MRRSSQPLPPRGEFQGNSNCFDFLERVDPRVLSAELLRENIRTIATVLAHCDKVLSAKLLADFEPGLRPQIIAALKNARQTPPEALQAIAAGLRERLYNQGPAKRPAPGMVKYGGPAVAAAMLRYISPEAKRNIKENDPALFADLRRLMYTFDDFMKSPDRTLQIVFAEIETRTLALALKVAMPRLKQRILENMSDRRATIVEDEIEQLGRVRMSDIEEAQQNIMDLAISMQKAGKIIIDERDENLV